jgi:ABC-type polysaccharide/polyol phosphate export permease
METSSPLGFIEQILLVIFMLMLFVGIAGGNPSMVIKPVFDIVRQLLGTILSLLCSLLLTVFRALITLLTSGLQALVAMLSNSRNIHR